MKYYFNFLTVPKETPSQHTPPTVETDPSFRFPTDPQFKQDGVYNQRCKYRITNFSIQNYLNSELLEINGKTLVVRFNDIPSINTYNMIAGITGVGIPPIQFKGLQPVEFHIRIPDNLVEQTTTTSTITQVLEIDPITATVPQHNIDARQMPPDPYEGNQQVEEHEIEIEDNGGGTIDGTITTAGAPNNNFLRNNISQNTFTEEIVGASCWGQVPNMTFWYYDANTPFQNLADNPNLLDVSINFTLEVEPVAVSY